MIALRSPSGETALRSFLEPDTLFAFDFDGTLVPIESHPDLVRLPSNITALLTTLASSNDVAVISGRGRSDLLRWFPVPPFHLIGNHGIEESQNTRQGLVDDVTCLHEYVQRLLADPLREGRAWIENKRYSLTIHSTDDRLLSSLETSIARKKNDLPPMRILQGKHCLNLLPGTGHTKATALLSLLKQLGKAKALFVGDDETDEDVFALQSDNIFSIRVGPFLRTQARYVLDTQEDVEWLLTTLCSSIT